MFINTLNAHLTIMFILRKKLKTLFFRIYIPNLFELTHWVRRPNFERVPQLKTKKKQTNIYVDVNEIFYG